MKPRVLITGARAPAAVELAQLFNRAGAEVHVADSTPLLLAAGLPCVSAGHRLPPARHDVRAYARAVATVVSANDIHLVVPTCEEVFFLAAGRDAGHDIPLFAPSLSLLREVHDKHRFIEIARSAGVAVPETVLLTSSAEVASIADRSRELVFKPCFSRFGVEALIAPSRGQLRRLKPSPEAPWVAQELLAGQEICAYGVARNGKLVAFCAYQPRYRMGKAASYYFEPVVMQKAEEIASAIISATRFHGQIAFDMIEDGSGRLMPIECNPRATSGVHLLSSSPELASLFLSETSLDGVLAPAADVQPAMVAAAMWMFGAPKAALHDLSRWRADYRRARDVLWVQDQSLNGRAFRVFGSYCREALMRTCTLREVATADIEWNGEALDAR